MELPSLLQNLPEIPGLNLGGQGGDGSSHKAGRGSIRERTVVIGDTVIAVENIGSVVMFRSKRNFGLAILGVLLVGAGIFQMMSSYGDLPLVGIATLLLGIGAIVLNLLQPPRKGLSIGTSDSRETLIVSTDERFLRELLEVLRKKVDTGSSAIQAQFDITNNVVKVAGGVALGAGAMASGAGGDIRRLGR